MELEKNYYRLVLSNQQEYFVEDPAKDTDSFLEKLDATSLLSTKKEYFKLQLSGTAEPVHFRRDKVFSTQKAAEAVISPNYTKIWKLIK